MGTGYLVNGVKIVKPDVITMNEVYPTKSRITCWSSMAFVKRLPAEVMVASARAKIVKPE